MSIKGKLTKEMMGPNLPVDMPAMNPAAVFFKEVRMLRFDYLTDPEIASRVIPSKLSLPDNAAATFLVIEYGFTFVGSYREAILGVNVLYKDAPYGYSVQLMLNSALPTMGGREMGIPKKMGFVEITQFEDTIAGYVERPKGQRLATGILRIDKPIEPCPEEIPGPSLISRQARPDGFNQNGCGLETHKNIHGDRQLQFYGHIGCRSMAYLACQGNGGRWLF